MFDFAVAARVQARVRIVVAKAGTVGGDRPAVSDWYAIIGERKQRRDEARLTIDGDLCGSPFQFGLMIR
jgi:hypothetical protein